ncbi:unnamed protein product [Effrenium voratum]|uniref:Uncharacterized protein n=1 Tax=Effrenium voratum TaxID=2562239 RepID=A0AA36JFD6_9DINO|nr:unnamed protein product [Effrenium voratum]CAJ1409491.1 unnamed protein product [Effrenium voratum]
MQAKVTALPPPPPPKLATPPVFVPWNASGPLTGQPAGPAAGRDAGGRPPDQLPRIKEMVMELAPHMHLCLEDLQAILTLLTHSELKRYAMEIIPKLQRCLAESYE